MTDRTFLPSNSKIVETMSIISLWRPINDSITIQFPNRAFVEFRSIEEASHFLHVMREEPITKNGPICRIYYDKVDSYAAPSLSIHDTHQPNYSLQDNGFDPTRAPSRKRKAGDSMDR